MVHIESGGTYKIINAKSNTSLDLSGGDNKSIIGYDYHGGNNQRWTLEWQGQGYYIKNHENGKYLTIDGHARDGCPVIANHNPTLWNIYPDEQDHSVYRIALHSNQAFNVDLTDYGNPTPGTPVQLWGKWDARNQVWRFEHP